jgi:hypothetical protein
MKPQYYIAICAALLLLGYAFGRYAQPAKVVTKEVKVIQQVETVKHDVQTVIKEVVKKDGTKETVTVIEDKSKDYTQTKTKDHVTQTTSNVKPQWRVQGLVGTDLNFQPIYGAGIERRIVGPVSAGIYANTKKQVGLSVSLEF